MCNAQCVTAPAAGSYSLLCTCAQDATAQSFQLHDMCESVLIPTQTWPHAHP